MTVETVSLFFALLTVAADVIVGAAVIAWLWGKWRGEQPVPVRRLADAIRPHALAFAWAVAVVATVGSLYYSEVAGFIPCRLCWYQRIAMYPLIVVLGIATAVKDATIRRYVLPIVLAGAAISAYHYQLERFPSQASVSCDPANPCTLVWVWKLHFISIPFMALSAFLLIAVFMSLLPRVRNGRRSPAEAVEPLARVHEGANR